MIRNGGSIIETHGGPVSYSLGFTIEVLVAILLGITIVYCAILNNRLKRLKADEQSLKGTIAELITATQIAERAVAGLKSTAHECEATLGERLRAADEPLPGTPDALKALAKSRGLDLNSAAQGTLDVSGKPFKYVIEVSRSLYSIEVLRDEGILVWRSPSIDYFSRTETRMDAALQSWRTQGKPFPGSESEVLQAFAAAGLWAGVVHTEPGYPEEELEAVAKAGYQVNRWDHLSHYFGGVSAVGRAGAAGDPRRGGAGRLLPNRETG